MVIKTEGECPKCGAPFRMKIKADLSETYEQIFKKALSSYPMELYCQECEEMVDPDINIVD